MPLTKRELLVDEANVYVIAHQVINRQQLQEFLTDEGFPTWTTEAEDGGETLAEVAGRVCYMSFAGGRGHEAYIQNIKDHRHGSVLEHATVSFVLTGVSRSFTHECIRHRAGWAYSQLSQRFVDETNAQFVVPPAINRISRFEDRRRIRELFEDTCKAAHSAYSRLVAELEWQFGQRPARYDGDVRIDTRGRKLVRGAARAVLPSATETKIVCTVNARALRHFLEMRAAEEADDEIRAVAMKIYDSVLPIWPDILGDYRVMKSGDGQRHLATDFAKV